jgi:hypothetical protein
MMHRFGTPTGEYGSGTEKEFKAALKRWGKLGKPWILFYFAEEDVEPLNSTLASLPRSKSSAKAWKGRDSIQPTKE